VPDEARLRYRPVATSEDERRERQREYDRQKYAKCRDRINAGNKARYAAKREVYNAARNSKRAANPEPYREKARRDRPKYREKSIAAVRRWHVEHRDEIKAKRKADYAANTEQHRLLNKENYRRNREARIAYMVEWRKQNPGYDTDRKKVDIQFRLAKALRSRLQAAMRKKRIAKAAGTLELCGCDLPTLKQHIEAQFLPGMSWANWTMHGWHVDHIRQVCTFDLTDPDQQRLAFHYTNLRPLWAEDNRTRPHRSLRRKMKGEPDVRNFGAINSD
jgi:hypothetical protein